MKAIGIVPGKSGVKRIDRQEPQVESPDDVKMRVLRVGICGTDREEVRGGRALTPPGLGDLVIGHEMMGQVVQTGSSVTRVKPGDLAVFTVRRGCNACLPCLMNRPDMCRTGGYRERGIWGLDGYQTEYVVDKENYVVRLPPELGTTGVLCEPLSIVEKAITESVRVQFARMPDVPASPDWLFGKRCLVAGLGPVGLLAIMALVLRGAEVYGIDIVDPDSAKPAWLTGIGGTYVDGRTVPASDLRDKLRPMDLIFEATGVPALEFELLDVLAQDGVYVLTGIPAGDRPVRIQGAELIRRLVLGNQVMLGSVNASRDHFQIAVNDLLDAHRRWGPHLSGIITQSFPAAEYESAFRHHSLQDIKLVLQWAA